MKTIRRLWRRFSWSRFSGRMSPKVAEKLGPSVLVARLFMLLTQSECVLTHLFYLLALAPSFICSWKVAIAFMISSRHRHSPLSKEAEIDAVLTRNCHALHI